MNALHRTTLFLMIVVLLAAAFPGRSASAQGSQDCVVQIPQWVRDRQQYETDYVYRPMTFDHDRAGTVRAIPVWLFDLQRYVTMYVYVPVANSAQPVVTAPSIPQWARNRQQYDTTYVYAPPIVLTQPVVAAPVPQWVRDRQEYETSYVYAPRAPAMAFEDARCSTVQAPNS